MVKFAEATLIEIVGYLIPGFILTISVVLLLFRFLSPEYPLSPEAQTVGVYLLILFFSYLNGHLVQALANWILHPYGEAQFLLRKTSENIIIAVALKIKDLFNIELGKGKDPKSNSESENPLKNTENDQISQKYDIHLMYQICRSGLNQYGNTSLREIYLYRESFYRGTTISTGLFTLSLIIFLFTGPPKIELSPNNPINISIYLLILMIITSLIFIFFMINRYMRFARYRAEETLLGFVASTFKMKA